MADVRKGGVYNAIDPNFSSNVSDIVRMDMEKKYGKEKMKDVYDQRPDLNQMSYDPTKPNNNKRDK